MLILGWKSDGKKDDDSDDDKGYGFGQQCPVGSPKP